MELTEARRVAIELALPQGIEWVGLEDALGRVLAEDVSARQDFPAESRSRLDGFALRSADTEQATQQKPVALKIRLEVLAAGHSSFEEIGERECVRILTGAPIPAGADAVVPQEDVSSNRDFLAVSTPVGRGMGIAPLGQDARRGELVLDRAEILTPTRLAILAGLGIVWVPVYRRPGVALLATGDEVRELGESMEGPWTFCNNRHLLASMVRLHGGWPIHLGVAADNPLAITDRLRDANADMVVTTGGMGQGDRDFILDVWERLGVEVVFSWLNLSPGKRSALGLRGKQVFWALPGNPWAAQVVYEELIAPAIRCCQGLRDRELPMITASLGSPLCKKEGLYRAVRGSLDFHGHSPTFIPVPEKSGTALAVLKGNFAYTILGPHVVQVPAGNEVQVRFF